MKSSKERWWQQLKPRVAETTRKGYQAAHRLAVQGYQQAKLAGRVAARKVLAVQRAANLPERLVEKSARSVLERPMVRESDRSWQLGYRQAAELSVPGIRQPEPDREMGS